MKYQAYSEIPIPIKTAAASMLQPYCPGLTPEKLEQAIVFKPEPESKEKLRTRLEASAGLNVSIPTIDRMLASGELTRVHVRGRVMIRQSEINRIVSGENRGMANEK